MGLNLVLNRFVVGHLHVAGIAVARQHVVQSAIGSVVAADMSCTNCSVHLVPVGFAAAVGAAVIAVVIPIAGDNSHLNCPVDYFALRQIDVDSSKIVAKIR